LTILVDKKEKKPGENCFLSFRLSFGLTVSTEKKRKKKNQEKNAFAEQICGLRGFASLKKSLKICFLRLSASQN